MSSTAPPVPAPPPAQAPAPAQGGFWSIPRVLLAYVLLTTLINTFKSPTPSLTHSPDSLDLDQTSGGVGVQLESPTQFQQTFLHIDADAKLPVFPTVTAEGKRLGAHRNLFKSDAVADLHLFITHDFYFDLERHAEQKVWTLENIPYNWSFTDTPHMTWNLTLTPSMLADFKVNTRINALENSSTVDADNTTKVASNSHPDPADQRSIYAHVFLAKAGQPIDSSQPDYNSNSVAYERFNLIRHRKRKVVKKTYKLLEARNIIDEVADGEQDKTVETEAVDADLIPYFCPSLDIASIMDIPPFKRNDIPSVILPLMHFNDLGAYYPVLYHNDFFMSSKNLVELNESLSEDLVLEVTYSHLSFMRWHMQTQMEQQWKVQTNLGASSERDTDMIREVLFDTNPVLLVITFAVSLLHSLFDFLAFKNDIQFWRKKKNMAGMSVQSLGVNCFFQTVIFLYLMDNDTSWMILMSSGVGLLIEYWKLGKAFNVSFSRQKSESPGLLESSEPSQNEDDKDDVSGQNSTEVSDQQLTTMSNSTVAAGQSEAKMFGVSMKYKLSEGYANSKTKEYDAIATTHLLYVVFPLVFGYSAYSLLHISHKSFYSWFLGSLVGFVYAFGFVLMTPQLFINYKLQSVAHMVRKSVMYACKLWYLCMLWL